MADEITKGIIDKADGVLSEVYKDAISPIVKPVGDILSFLPRTVKLALSGWEKWLVNGEETIRLTAESVREKIQAIPEEKLVEPEPYVAIPAMQQLSYCVNNEELRDLYANLLVSSMNADKKWQVHPAFVDIIKQLTPDEAKILKILPDISTTILPIVDLVCVFNQGEHTFISNFTTIGLSEIDNKELINAYYDNLRRLGLISIEDSRIIRPEAYNEIEHFPKMQYLDGEDFRMRFKRKLFRVTNLGVEFIKTCCK